MYVPAAARIPHHGIICVSSLILFPAPAFVERHVREKVDLSIKSQERRFKELDQTTREMVGRMLDDKLEGISRDLEMGTKRINDVVVEQNVNTQTVIIDALRHMIEQRKGGGEVLTSRLVEVSSMDVVTSVLGHLQLVGMDDRHEEVEENFSETFEWAYKDPKPG